MPRADLMLADEWAAFSKTEGSDGLLALSVLMMCSRGGPVLLAVDVVAVAVGDVVCRCMFAADVEGF